MPIKSAGTYMQLSNLCKRCSKQSFCGNGMTDYYCTGYEPTASDIKVPPFTDGLKEIIEATEKLAEKCDKINANVNKYGRKNICDVDGIDDDVRDIKKLLEETIKTIEAGSIHEVKNICESCVANPQCGNSFVVMCKGYVKRDDDIDDWGVCKDCALKENCAEYKPNKLQCEDYEREPQTNEEWLRSCSTEELAETIAKRIINSHTLFEYILHQDNRREEDLVREVSEWLKQPHNNEVEK